MRTSIGVQAYVYVYICIRAALHLSPARPCRYASLAGMQPANASAARVSDILVHLYRFLVVLSLLVPQPLHLPLRWLKWYLWLCHWRFMPRRTHCTRVSVWVCAASCPFSAVHNINYLTVRTYRTANVQGCMAGDLTSCRGQLKPSCSADLSLIKFQIFYQNLRHSFGRFGNISFGFPSYLLVQ